MVAARLKSIERAEDRRRVLLKSDGESPYKNSPSCFWVPRNEWKVVVAFVALLQ
jgi:hypothetical protein